MNKDDHAGKNIVWHHATVTRERREKLNQHRSVILWFTGITSPYEVPENPELIIDTEQPLEECIDRLMKYLHERKIIRLFK